MSEENYEIPEILKECSAEEIHERMLSYIPEEIDKSEGQFAWDFTMPTALEHARIKEFELNEAIKLIWPRFASGVHLDYHGETRGIKRKEGLPASGELHIDGDIGCTVRAGDLFSTEGTEETPAVEYAAVEQYVISEEKGVDIKVECTETGTEGNASANTIVMKVTANEQITSITNPKPVAGGTDEEDDDSYRERLCEYDITQGESYVGSIADYTRWAKEVEGVGDVKVLPAEDGSGIVKLIITTIDKKNADKVLCQAVYDHIMRPDNPIERKAPVNTILEVASPELKTITISAQVELIDTSTETVKEEFLNKVKEYLAQAMSDGEIRCTMIGRLLSSVEGIYDYHNLLLDGKTENYIIEDLTYPDIQEGDITLTELSGS